MKPPAKSPLGGAISNRAKKDGARLQVAPPRSGHGAENLGGAIFNRALEKGDAA